MQLNSSSDNQLSSSTSAGIGRRQVATDAINYQGSNYQILENRKTTIGEWNSVLGSTMSNTPARRPTPRATRAGRRATCCSRSSTSCGAAPPTLSFGSEPFTPNNELRYKTFELKNDFTKFGSNARVHLRRHASSATTRTTCSSTAASRARGSTTASTTSTPTRATAWPIPNRTTSAVTISQVPEPLHEHSRPRQAGPAADRALRRRLRAGRCGVRGAT